MRFRLHLSVDSQAFGRCLPLSYQYELSSFIYRTIATADAEYSAWLHDNGFTLGSRRFKLFTFSHLMPLRYTLLRDRGLLRIDSDAVDWLISFQPEKSTVNFVNGVFMEQQFQIGVRSATVQFLVTGVEALASPTFAPEMSFRMLSPMCLSYRATPEQTSETYLPPDAPETPAVMLNNLLNKYESIYGKPYDGPLDFAFKPTSRAKAKLVTIKPGTAEETNVRGFLFDFKMRAPEPLMRIMYDCGLGMKNSVGFGMVEIPTKRLIFSNKN